MASLEGVNDEEKDNDDEENKNNVEEEISSYISSWPLDQFLSSVFHQGKVQKKKNWKKKLTNVSFMYVCVAGNGEMLVFVSFFPPTIVW